MPEIDLEKHLLWIGFKNRFLTPRNPETLQRLIARLMAEYPHTFPNSRKILYTMRLLKQEGLITTTPHYDEEQLKQCLEKKRQEQPRATTKTLRHECMKETGYTETIQITDAGIYVYCESVKPHVKTPTTRTNTTILQVCREYQPAPDI